MKTPPFLLPLVVVSVPTGVPSVIPPLLPTVPCFTVNVIPLSGSVTNVPLGSNRYAVIVWRTTDWTNGDPISAGLGLPVALGHRYPPVTPLN